MKITNVDILSQEVNEHYPENPYAAMSFLIDKYEIDVNLASELIGVIWNTLHLKYPENLPNYLVNPYRIYTN